MDYEQSPAVDEAARLPLGVTLTAMAGFVDAVGFVRLKGLFVSFMSGNSTELAALPSLGRAGEAAAAAALVLLFVMGAFAGRLIGVSAGPWRKPALLVVVSALLTLAGLATLIEPASEGAALALSAAAMTLSMGVANSVLQKAGAARVTLTYVTGTLVHLGHALADTVTGQKAPWLAYLLQWLGLVCGAAVGALAALRFGALALLVPATLSALLALLLSVWVRRDLAAGRTP